MSGHSKWSQIKRKKEKTDSAKGKVFSKLAREISVAAKIGGGDPGGNSRLRLAVEKAREVNMPTDKIKGAIAKGVGGLEGAISEEIMYEGYAQGGVALLISCLTDNRNRTLTDVRMIMTKGGGRLAEQNSVAWMFARKGFIVLEGKGIDEEKLLNEASELGADDVQQSGEAWEVTTEPQELEKVSSGLKAKGLPVTSSRLTYLPKNTVPVSGEEAEKILKLIANLEDNDDVQEVFANFDLPEEALSQAEGGQ